MISRVTAVVQVVRFLPPTAIPNPSNVGASKMSKRLTFYTSEDVENHKTGSDCWISRHGKVYNISQFVPDHPGGDDILLEYAGKDIDGVMENPDEHFHSESAYAMLDEYVIGRLGTAESIIDENWVATEDFHPEDTNEAEDFAKSHFLDLRKPLFPQVWSANWSKSYYLQQVHQPRHLPESARLFGPWYLEIFTRTSWYVIPLIWAPISTYMFIRSVFQFTGPLPPFMVQPFLPMAYFTLLPLDSFVKAGACWALGVLIWTLIEYGMHRLLFHIDYRLPDKPFFLMLHFLLHGIHHYLPMDRLRLVMPPVLFTALQSPFTSLAHKLFPPSVANGIIAGAFAMYIAYDTMHYALHHTKLPQYMIEQKKYHLAHHYKNFELGFGITSKLWDYVFNTVLPM